MNTERPDNDGAGRKTGPAQPSDETGVSDAGDGAGGSGDGPEDSGSGRGGAGHRPADSGSEREESGAGPVDSGSGPEESGAGPEESGPGATGLPADEVGAADKTAGVDNRGEDVGGGVVGVGVNPGKAGAQEADSGESDTREADVQGADSGKGDAQEAAAPKAAAREVDSGAGDSREAGDQVDAQEAGAGIGDGRGRRGSRVAVAAVVAGVLLVGGGGALVAARASGDSGAGVADTGGTPPPLALDGYSGGGIAVGEPDPYGTTYRAGGTLPGGPGAAAVYAAEGSVGKDAVTRLAAALGVAGTPVTEGQYWKVGGQDGSGPSLQVNKAAPGAWTFSRYAPGTDACEGATLTCVHDPAAPAADPVSAAVAKKAAAPVLKAVGQDDAKVDASQLMGAQRVVNADPVVDGLPTYGWTTGLTVSAQGEVVGGSGQLKAPAKGDTYPVLSARKTLELMNAAPRSDHRMGIGGCAGTVPAKDRLEAPCATSANSPAASASSTSTTSSAATASSASATVEHAVFGLAVHSVGGTRTLVPSWLFAVREPSGRGTFTVTYPAVDPEFLASASPSTAPTPTSTANSASRDIRADGYSADGRNLTVIFTGGVCAEYRATAAETSGKVTVKVTETRRPGKVCVMIARIFHRTVRLDAPVGGRRVEGSDGKALPVRTVTEQPSAGPSLAR
ncbi:hypothetical protein [Streptomyces sp. NPDC005423]|uniref:hypothetical protein n=1 Tax=Streptomyces sp. NPDC005423 TaxID=3155343 RepID=UPI0033BBC7BC